MWLMDFNMQKTAAILPYKYEFDLCDVDEIKEVPMSVCLTRYFGGFLFWRPPQSATKDCLEQMDPLTAVAVV